MSEDNKLNILYFEGTSMRDLYDTMDGWQQQNRKRFLSMGIQKESEKFCCIALTNPSEVVIVCGEGKEQAHVVRYALQVSTDQY